jgi:hypothetical protein
MMIPFWHLSSLWQTRQVQYFVTVSAFPYLQIYIYFRVADPDQHVFGPPGSGSGSSSTRYGSGSFYNQTKIVRKTLILTVL